MSRTVKAEYSKPLAYNTTKRESRQSRRYMRRELSREALADWAEGEFDDEFAFTAPMSPAQFRLGTA